MKKISLTRKELENFGSHALGLTQGDLRRMSTQLLAQLLQLKINGDPRAVAMAAEIKCLEQLSGAQGGPGKDLGKTIEDWIVFKRFNGSNYYLTVARLDEGDQNIELRLRQVCEFDFPFLQEAQLANQANGWL